MVVGFAPKYLKSSRRAFSLLHQPCLTMTHIKQIQAHLIVSGAVSDPVAAGKVVAFRGDLSHAYDFFRFLPHRSAFAWNTMIRAFVEKSAAAKAVSLYKQMVRSGVLPNNYTFSFLLRACVELLEISLGLICHGQAIKLGWESYDFVQNGLVHMYATCSCMDSARKLFDASFNRDVITWTAVINGYVKSGKVLIAQELFDQMPDKNVVSWSTMITGYAQIGLFQEALGFFNEMQLAGIRPNRAGIVGALSACAFLGALDQGKWIHAYIDKHNMELGSVLGAALIDMYAKCGCMESALHVFDDMPKRDVYAFTSLISGLANHGQSENAIKFLARMQSEGVQPNEVTFICILSACGRMGLVDEGLRIFESMNNIYGIEPGVQHYGCLVDLLGQAGMLKQAKEVIRGMPMEPDSYVLGALLNACIVHGDGELGKEMVDDLVERSLDHDGIHVLLSNIYASANQWADVEKIRKEMEENKVKKVPGCSLIEVDGVVCEFIAGDWSGAYGGDSVVVRGD